MKFKGYNPYIYQYRGDKGWKVSFDVSQDEYDTIKDLPKLQDMVFDIHIEYGK